MSCFVVWIFYGCLMLPCWHVGMFLAQMPRPRVLMLKLIDVSWWMVLDAVKARKKRGKQLLQEKLENLIYLLILFS